jgi:hypothetical protein
MASQPPVGEEEDRYRTLCVLGRGAGTKVLLVEDALVPGRRLAMKRFPALRLETGDSQASEARTLESLAHENIAGFVGEGCDREGRYLLMEFVDGSPIDSFCSERRLPIRSRLLLLRDVLRAVEYAHSRLIVHADLKPANVLVTGEGQVKLVDFGVSRWLALSAGGQPAGVAGFSAPFASPEQRAAGDVSTRSDVYGLGMLAYVLLAGVVPPAEAEGRVPRMSASLARLPREELAGIAAARTTTAQKLMRELGGDLDAWVRRATEREPADRYSSAAEMAADLEAVLEGAELVANPASRWRRFLLWCRRYPVMAAMGGAAAAILLVSCCAVGVEHLRLLERQRLTERRLIEVLRLTGALDRDLSLSVRGLPDSEPARRLLEEGAAGALERLAAAGPYSPRVNEALAGEAAAMVCGAGSAAGDRGGARRRALAAELLERLPRGEAKDRIRARLSGCGQERLPGEG